MSEDRSFRELRVRRREFLARFQHDPEPIDVQRVLDAERWLLRGGVIVPWVDDAPAGGSVPAEHLAPLRDWLAARVVPRYAPRSHAAASSGAGEQPIEVILRQTGQPSRRIRGWISGLDTLRGQGPEQADDAEYTLLASLRLRLDASDLPDAGAALEQSQVALQFPGPGGGAQRRWLELHPFAAAEVTGDTVVLAIELREHSESAGLPVGPLCADDLGVCIQWRSQGGGGGRRIHPVTQAPQVTDLDWRELQDAAELARRDPQAEGALAARLYEWRPLIERVGRGLGLQPSALDDLVQHVLAGRPRRPRGKAVGESDGWRVGLVDRICEGAMILRTPREFIRYLYQAIEWAAGELRRDDARIPAGDPSRELHDVAAGLTVDPALAAMLADEQQRLKVAAERLDTTDRVILDDWLRCVPKRDTARRICQADDYPDARLCHSIKPKLRLAGFTDDQLKALRWWVEFGEQPLRCEPRGDGDYAVASSG